MRNSEGHGWLSLSWKGAILAVTALTLVMFLASQSPRSAAAATTIVMVGERDGRPGDNGEEFNANTVNITEGDTVQWDWFDGTHNVTPWDPADFTGTSITYFNSSGDSYSWTFNTAGTVWYYCTLHAELRDLDDDEDGTIEPGEPDFGKMIGRINIAPAVTDTTGPIASSAAAVPNPTNGAASVTLTATIDDTTTGGSNIQAAEYFVDVLGGNGTGTPLSAADGTFDAVSEAVTASVDVSALSLGTHNIFVQGQDSAGNWGGADVVFLEVTAVPPGAESATITILGGGLSVTTNPIDFGTVALTGADQTLDASPAAWSATDARGSGAGWNVTVSSTDFTSAGGTITVDNFKLQLLDANIVTVAGNAPPTSQVTGYQPLSAVPLALLSAAATTGMGTYDFTPDGRLVIPGESAPGDYEAFMTVSINSGP